MGRLWAAQDKRLVQTLCVAQFGAMLCLQELREDSILIVSWIVDLAN